MTAAQSTSLVPMRCGICDVRVEDREAHFREAHEPHLRKGKGRSASRSVVPSDRSEATDTAAGAPASRPFAIVQVSTRLTGLGVRRTTTRSRANPDMLPIEYFNELALLRDRLLAVYHDLDGATVWSLVGQIAALGLAADQAEAHAALIREEKSRQVIEDMRRVAAQEQRREERAEDAYVPPPLDVRGHRRCR